ncbi:hypothetical protein INT43_005183 [Umbelopsis isabellina]|uniref:Uncharacterized protein n=1 Tax=Mortierella isabellina TaxID=91625 RepID=A0A8H7PH06_MORIS|nr:hypothetical protein INT43_005183 [Umbelopsis isabellina]
MKLSIGVTALAALAAVVGACERDCRLGVAHDFAGVYHGAIAHTLQLLKPELTQISVHDALPSQISAAVSEDALRAGIEAGVSSSIDKMISATTGETLDKLYYAELFNPNFAKDVFKGDCNAPLPETGKPRLTRKVPDPPGSSWTLEECEKMDYICGNPPSICHFLPQVKERLLNQTRVRLSQYSAVNGVFHHTLDTDVRNSIVSVLSREGAGSLVDDPIVDDMMNTIITKQLIGLSNWSKRDVQNLCRSSDQDILCNSWDAEIKKKILVWP